jgi:hypothetical protein
MGDQVLATRRVQLESFHGKPLATVFQMIRSTIE